MATDHNFIVKNGLEVGGVLIVNSSGQLQAVTVTSDLSFNDNVKAQFGASDDLQIYHDGSNSILKENGTGNLRLQTGNSIDFRNGGGADLFFRANLAGSTNLYHNKVLKLETTADGIDVSGQVHINDYVVHNGDTNTYLGFTSADTFDLVTGGTTAISADANAAYLRYQGSAKLATTSSGVDITGNVVADGLNVASDTDTISTLGRAKIGAFVTDYAYFSHIDNATSTNYALNQNSTGATSVNAKTGASVSLKINNVNKLTVDSSGNTTFAGEIYAKDSDSTTDPTITFTGHTDSGFSISDYGNGTDQINIIRDGSAMALINQAGVLSNANVYTGYTSSFRNFGGTWKATTGTTGSGFEFHNTADSVTPLKITSDGKLYLTNQNNSYLEHTSQGAIKNTTAYGYTTIGAENGSYTHIQTDRGNFYFNKRLTVNEGIISSYDEDLSLRRANSDNNRILIQENKIVTSTSTSQGNSAMILGGVIAEAALEEGQSTHFYLPGVSTNRLAGANRRHTVTATLDGSSISIGDEAFIAGAGNFQVGSLTSSSVVVITISGFSGLSYGSHVGIVFGNVTWRAKDVEIETSTDGGTTWTSRTDQTNQPSTTVYKYFSSGGTATNAIRFTLTNFNTTSTRINHIFAYNYNSQDQHFTQPYKNESIHSDWTWLDTRQLKFGNGGDLAIQHNGTNSSIVNNTGNLIIENASDDGDITFYTDDGSGGTTPYLAMDGGNTLTRVYKTMLFQDSVKASFGNSEDMRIKHDGSNGTIDNYTGDLLFRNNVDDMDIILQSDDGSGGLADYIRLDGSDTSVRVSQHLKLPDNKAIYFGDGQDLNIWHSGTNSLIDHIGTGNLYLRNTTNDKSIYLQTDDGSGGLASYVIANGNSGTVTLAYYGAQKLITKSDGVDITGELQADSLDIDGAGDISGNLTIHGNLTVNGSTVTNSATNTTIEDALIELGSGNTGTNSNDLGLILERGTSGNNAFIGFDESDDQVVFALTTATGASTGNLAFSSFLPIKTGTLNTTGGVTHNVSATSEEVIVNVTNDAGHRNALTLNHEFDRDIGIHYHTSGGDYEVWMDSAGDDSLLFSPGTSGNPALELYQNKKAQFYGTAQFDSTVTFDVAGTNVEFLSDTLTREVLSFKQSGTTKWTLKLKNNADLNLVPASASSNLQINTSDFVDGDRNLTVASINNSGTSTLSGDVLVNGAHNNNGNAKLAVESGVTHSQVSLYGDQIQLGNTSMNWNAKFFWDADGGQVAAWDSNLTFFTQGSNTGSASARDIIFKPQTSGTAIATERMRIKGDGNVGIGISSPGQLLDVGGIIRSSATNPQVRIHTSSGSNTGYLVFGDSADDDIGQIYYSHANNEMGFVVNAGTKMIVKSTGYVGVGTTSPAEKLEVQGNIRSERIIADGSGALFRKQVDNWTSGAQTHDILYNGWTNSTGDYTYVKAAGNGLSGHGILQVGDLGTWIGQTDLEQGALADSNTAPIDNVFAYFRSDQAHIKTALGINTNNVNDKLNLYDADDNVGIYIQTATSGNASGDGLRIGLNNSHAFFWQFENSPVAIATSGTERFTVLGNGNVGINNTSPSYKLDVNGETRILNQLRIQANTPSIRFIDNEDNSDGYIQANAGTLRFYADDANEVGASLMTWNIDGSEKMRLRNNGFLGIGATTPLDLLHLKSSTTDARAVIDGHTAFDAELKFAENGTVQYTIGHDAGTNNFVIGTTNVDTDPRFIITSSGDVGINRTGALSDNKLSIQADSGEGAIGIQCNQLDGSTKLFDVYNSGGTNLYQQVLQNDSTPNLIWRMFDGSSTITERMRFTHDGKLGINDSAPSKAKLQINQQSNTLAAIQLTNSSQTSSNFGTYPISIFFGDEQVGSSARHQASINAVREAWSNSPAALTFKTSATVNGATEKMRIASDGDVGIGTTTPAFKLDVNGNVRANGYIRVNSGGSFRLYNSAGNAWVELFFDETNNMLQVQRGFKPSGDSQLDLGTNTVRWRNVYADTYYGSGANLTGVLTGAQDLYTGSSHPGNSFIDFDDDAGVGGATNSTSLVSVGSMNFIMDSNNNGSDQFNWMHNNTAPSSAASLMTLDSSGNLDVTGQLSATTKSFDIEHPTKEGKRLHHGVLEGPEHAVYIRGRTKGSLIQLPEYWTGLVHEDTITVQLTPIGKSSELYVKDIADNKVLVSNDTEYFYFIQAERKDVERFEVEYEV